MGKYSHLLMALILALPLLLASCTMLPFGGLPTINSFTAGPTTVSEGSSSELSWSVSNATALIIDQGIGTISASGSSTVTPTVTTTYTLTAVNQQRINISHRNSTAGIFCSDFRAVARRTDQRQSGRHHAGWNGHVNLERY
jgi:hypothetical protein